MAARPCVISLWSRRWQSIGGHRHAHHGYGAARRCSRPARPEQSPSRGFGPATWQARTTAERVRRQLRWMQNFNNGNQNYNDKEQQEPGACRPQRGALRTFLSPSSMPRGATAGAPSATRRRRSPSRSRPRGEPGRRCTPRSSTAPTRPGRSICFVITAAEAARGLGRGFPDRIVHHLLYRRIGPRFERAFIADSCACIEGRGTLYAGRRLEAKVRSITANWTRPAYYLKCDVASFFPRSTSGSSARCSSAGSTSPSGARSRSRSSSTTRGPAPTCAATPQARADPAGEEPLQPAGAPRPADRQPLQPVRRQRLPRTSSTSSSSTGSACGTTSATSTTSSCSMKARSS
jgi:hypothetical protein